MRKQNRVQLAPRVHASSERVLATHPGALGGVHQRARAEPVHLRAQRSTHSEESTLSARARRVPRVCVRVHAQQQRARACLALSLPKLKEGVKPVAQT